MTQDNEVTHGPAGEPQDEDRTAPETDLGGAEVGTAGPDQEQQDRGGEVAADQQALSGQADVQAENTRAAEAQIDQTIEAIQSGEEIALTSNQRPPEEADRLRWEREENAVVHDGFVRAGDVGAGGLPATSIHARMAEMPAREWQVNEQVYNSPGFKALSSAGQDAIDQLLMRAGAVVRTDVLVVPLEDPSFTAERVLPAGSRVPDGLGFVPVHYMDRARRAAATRR